MCKFEHAAEDLKVKDQIKTLEVERLRMKDRFTDLENLIVLKV